MEYRGIRYAIRIGIEREQWRVVISLPGNGLTGREISFGTRQHVENTARSPINI
jgi:hypothetical protein